MICFTLLLAATAALAQGTLYVGAWPRQVLVIDESQQKVIDRIQLSTGVPRGLHLSLDRKKIYVDTWDKDGIEVIDLGTRKVSNAFVLDEGNKRVRPGGFAPDPQDKVIYTAIRVAEKKVDRFEIEKTRFAVIDLVQKKITKTYDLPKEEDQFFGAFGGYRVSPDGKYLYIFRDKIMIFDTGDFKLVETIELAKPEFPGMLNIGLGGPVDPVDEPGFVTALFNSTDPIVRRRIFGIARFDLTRRTFEFTPVGPSATGMAGLHLTPDHKTGYTVAFNGNGANRRTEFWVFDMPSRKLVQKAEFDSRSRFSFGVSSNGAKLYIHGAGYTIEIFDAKTLTMERTVDIDADMTTNLIVLPRS